MRPLSPKRGLVRRVDPVSRQRSVMGVGRRGSIARLRLTGSVRHTCNSIGVGPRPSRTVSSRHTPWGGSRREPRVEEAPMQELVLIALKGSQPAEADGDEVPAELEWQERALCAQTDPEAFFPEKGGSTREAKRVCLSCEVRVQCLDYALENDERFGIWGGLSERERRRVKKPGVGAGGPAWSPPPPPPVTPPPPPRPPRRPRAPPVAAGTRPGHTSSPSSSPGTAPIACRASSRPWPRRPAGPTPSQAPTSGPSTTRPPCSPPPAGTWRCCGCPAPPRPPTPSTPSSRSGRPPP